MKIQSVASGALIAVGFFAWVAQAQTHVADPRWMDMEDCYNEAYDVAYSLARLTVSMPNQYRMVDIASHERLDGVRSRCATLGYTDEVEAAVVDAVATYKRERAELAARNRQILETYNPAAIAPARPAQPEARDPVCRPGSCR